ncbi:hypothetical protein Osc7112_1191 [Oscillatoria nigro-viridis PCC 7112]|uniref:Uncharacterized protein n=1 Tax=Phormidium nigroviride PCC 7112 TaxID=179408 RepID=K9VC51_9CYAN|nr:hypothetical protein Osc7112_1191 [Oscillatoria nigro-viridis PCC 7112]
MSSFPFSYFPIFPSSFFLRQRGIASGYGFPGPAWEAVKNQ